VLSWILHLLDRLPGWISGPLYAVVGWFQAPWRVLLAFFHLLARYFHKWSSAWWWFTHEIERVVWEIVIGFWRITTKTIPTAIRHAVNSLYKTITTWVIKLYNILSKYISDTVKWARSWINFLQDTINNVIAWARAHFNDLIDWVNRIGNQVADLVLHPEKLVEWILGEIWKSWWSIFQRWAPRIMEYLLRSGVGITLRMLPFIERVIVRLF